MNRRLIFEPEAEAEIIAAATWYGTYSTTLARDFVFAVETALGAIQSSPHQYQVIYRDVRRANLSRFPYGVMYVVREEEIIVVACFHGRRNPRRWRQRL